MAQSLNGKKVAIVVTDGFEQVELTEPKKALEAAGATALIVSPKDGKVKGWKLTDWGDEFKVDIAIANAKPDEFDALLLPGGVMNPDKLRVIPEVIRFIRGIYDAKKPIAAICHGPWTLIEADAVRGRRITSWPTLRSDLKNAGANWVDEPVVVDDGIVTSRKPDDIPKFNEKMIEEFAEGEHRRRGAANNVQERRA
ncbi:type 1 glutamine amidotransferase domain-containing protein [Pendulispora albinea]|uniref:Type 1 glutamine amidotransferase n=1 Tax=Pendulispora albinea TaxID=2741071 RepID=A0ABZ2LR82_9BACT